MTPKRIIWHHSAINAKRYQFDEIDKYHKARGFPLSTLGYYVGYHYLVEYDGTIRQARTDQEIGAHDKGENVDSIGICLAGDFTAQLPTEAQSASVATLLREITTRHNIPITRVEPHRIDDDTSCPGTFLPDNWLILEYLKRQQKAAIKLFGYIGKKYNLL